LSPHLYPFKYRVQTHRIQPWWKRS
jgi:hypothetical protein